MNTKMTATHENGEKSAKDELGFMKSYDNVIRPTCANMDCPSSPNHHRYHAANETFTPIIEQMPDAGGLPYYSAMNSPSSKDSQSACYGVELGK